MRLVTYDRGGARRLGAWVGDAVVDLPDAVGHPAFPTTLEALVARCGGTTMDAARDALDCPAYLEGCFVDAPQLLTPFLSPAFPGRGPNVGRDGEPAQPLAGTAVDGRLELACIVGRECRSLSPRQARRAIFGYTLTAGRGRRGGRGPAPAERHGTSVGPCVVTADGAHPSPSRLVVRVNDEVWAGWDVSLAEATFAGLISEASHRSPLLPGDVVRSGLVAGEGGLRRGRCRGRGLPRGAVLQLDVEEIA